MLAATSNVLIELPSRDWARLGKEKSMERTARVFELLVRGALSGVLLMTMFAVNVHAQDRRAVPQPTTPAPPYCRVLQADLPRLSPTAFVPPRAFDDAIENAPPDTARINQAILQCSQSVASTGFTPPAVVELAAGNAGNASFLSGPIVMQSGVTLLIDPG